MMLREMALAVLEPRVEVIVIDLVEQPPHIGHVALLVGVDQREYKFG